MGEMRLTLCLAIVCVCLGVGTVMNIHAYAENGNGSSDTQEGEQYEDGTYFVEQLSSDCHLNIYANGHTYIYVDEKRICDEPFDYVVYDYIDSLDPSECFKIGKIYDGTRQYGMMEKDGTIISDTIWDDIMFPENGYCKVEKNEKYGAINTYGDVVVDVMYDKISSINCGFGFVNLGDSCYILNVSTGEKIKCDIDKDRYLNYCYYENVAAVVDNQTGLYGYINTDGTYAIEPKYRVARGFESGYATVFIEEDGIWKCGIIDHDGNTVVDFEWRDAYYEMDGYCCVEDFDGVNKIIRMEDGSIILSGYDGYLFDEKDFVWVDNEYVHHIKDDSSSDNKMIERVEHMYGLYKIGYGFVLDPIYEDVTYEGNYKWTAYNDEKIVCTVYAESDDVRIDYT